MADELTDLASLLVYRLERLSADSYWAHQASGLRGALLRLLESAQSPQSESEAAARQEQLRRLVRQGFTLLENGAREIQTPDTWQRVGRSGLPRG
jgi:hypothetical protein